MPYQNAQLDGVDIVTANFSGDDVKNWNMPNDVVSNPLFGGGSHVDFGGASDDIITFDGRVSTSDFATFKGLREKRRPVIFKADIVGKYYTSNLSVYVVIEDLVVNEEAGYTSDYPFRFRLRVVKDADNYSVCSRTQVDPQTHTFTLTAKPVLPLPVGSTSPSQTATGTRTGEDGAIPYIQDFKGNCVSYTVTGANQDKNNVEMSIVSNEDRMNNGVFAVESKRGDGASTIGGIDVDYWNNQTSAWVNAGYIEVQAYDSQWRSLLDSFPTIEPIRTENPEYGCWMISWAGESSGLTLQGKLEMWYGHPYVKLTLSNVGSPTVYGVQVILRGASFRYHVRFGQVIDATAIPASLGGTTTAITGVNEGFQRKVFFAAGLWWVFYSDGTNMVFRTSADGASWSAATTVRACTLGRNFSVDYDGNFGYYAFAASETANTALFFRRFTPNSDGTVTYSAAEQTAVAAVAGTQYFRPSITALTNGTVMIAYGRLNGGNQYPYVTKCSTTDGTWTTDTTVAFPIQLSAVGVGANGQGAVVAQTAAKAVMVYTEAAANQTVKAKTWNGSAIGSEETCTTSVTKQSYYYSICAVGDDVYLAVLENSANNIILVKRTAATATWSAETTIKSAASATSGPVLNLDSSQNLYVIWAGGTAADHIYYKMYDWIAGAWDAAESDWITVATIAANDAIGGTCSNSTCKAGTCGSALAYLSGAGSPYTVNFGAMMDDGLYGPGDYNASYLTGTNPLAANAIVVGVAVKTKALDRHFRATKGASTFSTVAQMFNTATTSIAKGGELEPFWIFARMYQDANDNPTELGKECLVDVTVKKDFARVT